MSTGKRAREEDDKILLLLVQRCCDRQEQSLHEAGEYFTNRVQQFFERSPRLDGDTIWRALKSYERTYRANIDPLVNSLITTLSEEPGSPFYGCDKSFYCVMYSTRATGGEREWDPAIRMLAEECFQRLPATPQLGTTLDEHGAAWIRNQQARTHTPIQQSLSDAVRPFFAPRDSTAPSNSSAGKESLPLPPFVVLAPVPTPDGSTKNSSTTTKK
jgi:hypothetical protein